LENNICNLIANVDMFHMLEVAIL